jgi:pimeloyl-ACP methyl ester carboxylesterase
MGNSELVRVRHRHIVYIQGYDPRGLAQYYRMFRTELRSFARLYGISASVTRPQSADGGERASWTIETKAADWEARTDYDFLRFEDFIQKDLAQPIWRIVFHAVWIYLRLIVRGTALRFFMTSWRFATFITWPHLVLLAEAICVAALAWVVQKGLNALGVPNLFSIAVATAVFVAVLGTVLKYTEKRTYVLYLLSDTIWTWQFSHRQRPDWDRRIDRFAKHLVDVISASDAQEIVLVGHSSGSFLGVELMARALKLDPSLGRHGPRIVLLTIGANFPIVGYHKASQDFRDHLGRLAIEPSIDWIDCQARKDVMNFFQFDPLAAHGINVGAAGRNPTIVPVRFREIIRPENYNAFRRKFFRVHFQFVMANQVPHAYDFFMIVCGPVPLRERMAAPEAALAVATGDAPAREWAWKQLENNPAGCGDDAETGAMEPPARRRS